MDQSETWFLHDRSGRRYGPTQTRWRGDDGSPLALSHLPAAVPETVDTGERSIWRYAAALPIDRKQRISLGEGCTPLRRMDWKGQEVFFKLEWFNPTGSFKDRGVSVMMSHLASLGVSGVVEDSSGNAGASVAAYAAAAGMTANIVAPASTSAAKLLQVRAYGARLHLVEGDRAAVAAEAARLAVSTPYASHNWSPFFLEGVKTVGYEIVESLGWEAPENVVVVAGSGSLVLGCDLAFTELMEAGVLTRRPRIFVGQPEEWAAIADAVNSRDTRGHPDRAPTLAEGAAIAHPVRLPEVAEAIHRSGGRAVGVSEQQIGEGLRALAAKGLYAEPTSAVAAAALDVFVADGSILPSERTVVILTGTGLKSADAIVTLLAQD